MSRHRRALISLAFFFNFVCQASVADEPKSGQSKESPSNQATVQEEFFHVPGQDTDWLVVAPYGTLLKKFIWDIRQIPVCWDEAATDQAENKLRLIVQGAVEKSWSEHANIDFIGWGICDSPRAAGVHIIVRDELPRTHGIGSFLNRRPGGVVLNFRMSAWRNSCQPSQAHNDCIRYLAVHEFGHVLGFVHEHLTADAPPECRAEVGTYGAKGNWKATIYDPQSIMNYCSNYWTLYSGGAQPAEGQTLDTLSALDKAAVRKVYGARSKSKP
jgi:hypothetical protein